jgi:hypothetical protein
MQSPPNSLLLIDWSRRQQVLTVEDTAIGTHILEQHLFPKNYLNSAVTFSNFAAQRCSIGNAFVRCINVQIACAFVFHSMWNKQSNFNFNDLRARAALTIERFILMNRSTKSLALAAAFAGLFGGTAARVNAQPTNNAPTTATAGVMIAQAKQDLPKHSCKGQNDCKGQGGGDKKHAGKNSCKGQGACATDGSKPKAS